MGAGDMMHNAPAAVGAPMNAASRRNANAAVGVSSAVGVSGAVASGAVDRAPNRSSFVSEEMVERVGIAASVMKRESTLSSVVRVGGSVEGLGLG